MIALILNGCIVKNLIYSVSKLCLHFLLDKDKGMC